jgi:hypothetical protein
MDLMSLHVSVGASFKHTQFDTFLLYGWWDVQHPLVSKKLTQIAVKNLRHSIDRHMGGGGCIHSHGLMVSLCADSDVTLCS